jgi:hypothetical protein
MNDKRLAMSVGGFCLLFVASCAVSESDHGHQMNMEVGSSGAAMDVRQALNLPPAVQEGLKLTMREHLEALQAIVAALAREDYEKAAAVAHEDLGFPKHHQAMQREQGAPFPPKYQELAMAHHQVAEDLAQAIPSRDMKKILPHLDRTMKACVACHQAYKL